MSYIRFTLLALLFQSTIAFATDKVPTEVSLISPDADAFVTVRYDLLRKSKLDAHSILGDAKRPELFAEIEERWIGFPIEEIERVTALYSRLPEKLSTDRPPLFIVTRTKPIDRPAIVRKLRAVPVFHDLDRPPDEERKRVRHGDVFELPDAGFIYFVGERTAVVGSAGSSLFLFAMLSQIVDASRESPLRTAVVAASERNAIVIGLRGSVLNRLASAWPEEAKEFSTLSRASSVTLVANIEPRFHLSIRADFADDVESRAGHAALAQVRKWANDALPKLARAIDKDEAEFGRLLLVAVRDSAEPTRSGRIVQAEIKMELEDFKKFANSTGRLAARFIRGEADRLRFANNLKQIGLGLHNFHDTTGEFGLKHRAKDGIHAGLSWRVQILPYIEQDELYRQFHLDEPWDSEHNMKLVMKMPKVYAPPNEIAAKAGYTHYRMIDGHGTFFRTKTFTEITDGASNTLAIVEAGATVWTKPDEIEYDPKQPLPKFGGHFKDGFHVLFADANIKFVQHPADEKLLRAWITANGGEEIPKTKK